MCDRYDVGDIDTIVTKNGSATSAAEAARVSATAMTNEAREKCSTKDLDLSGGCERRPVREHERVYEIDGTEARTHSTVAAFRVVAECDLHDAARTHAETSATWNQKGCARLH